MAMARLVGAVAGAEAVVVRREASAARWGGRGWAAAAAGWDGAVVEGSLEGWAEGTLGSFD
jgi:hypothetical protein